MAEITNRRRAAGRRERSNLSGLFFAAPYALVFLVFILIPVILAVILSFTNFNAIEWPRWVGFLNYITLLTSDEVFMQFVLPNTVLYAVVVVHGNPGTVRPDGAEHIRRRVHLAHGEPGSL